MDEKGQGKACLVNCISTQCQVVSCLGASMAGLVAGTGSSNRRVPIDRQRWSKTPPPPSSYPGGPAAGARVRAGREFLCISPSFASDEHTSA
jgi:hypothetical protein